MAILRGIWGIIAGAFVAALLGAAFDLFRNVYGFDTEAYVLIYIWVAGISGIVAAWIAVSITGGWGLKPKAKPEAGAGAGSAAKHATKAPPSKTPPGFADVPGMPTFDYTKQPDPAKASENKPGTKQG
jgi:hypothetical protein